MEKRAASVFLCVLVWWPSLLPYAEDLTKENKYVASKYSIHYHLPTCKKAKRIQAENRVFFTSAQEAIKARYVPCSRCKPPDKDASKDREIQEGQMPSSRISWNLASPEEQTEQAGQCLRTFLLERKRLRVRVEKIFLGVRGRTCANS